MEQENSNEDVKQDFIATLRHFKDDYRGGIPEDIKSSISPDPLWKVRKGWFAAVKILFFRIRDKLNLPAELKNEMINFEKRELGKLIIQEDIDVADRTIEKVLGELEK